MSRILKSLIAMVAVGLATVGIAVAASTPAVTAESATNVGDTTATLTATINPNGSATGYSFAYGPTSAYGFSTNSHRIGAGSRPVTVRINIAGLTPGTPYHFHVAALNGAGTASGADKVFTTTGPPPAAVVTGPPVNVGKTVATATGSINPQGAATTWAVQYGVSLNYGSQTIPAQPLAAVATSLPVSVLLSGLAPGTLFHYRLVAYHGGGITSAGNGRDVLHRAEHAAQASIGRAHLALAGPQKAVCVHDHGQAQRRRQHSQRLQVLGDREPEVLPRAQEDRQRRGAGWTGLLLLGPELVPPCSTPPPRPGSRSRSTSTATATSRRQTSQTR